MSITPEAQRREQITLSKEIWEGFTWEVASKLYFEEQICLAKKVERSIHAEGIAYA